MPDWSATAEPVPYAKLDNLRFQESGGSRIVGLAVSPNGTRKPELHRSPDTGPQTLNLYTYATDNPTTLTDPRGHMPAPPPLSAGQDQASTMASFDWGVENGLRAYISFEEEDKKVTQKAVNDANKAQKKAHQQANQGVPVVLPGGATVPDRNSPTGELMSPTANLQPVVNAGENVGAHYIALSVISRVAADVYLLEALNHYVGHGGVFDYQRSGSKYSKQFRDVSNFNVGLFAHSAGLSLQQILRLTGVFARVASNFGNAPLGPHGVPMRTEDFIVLGFSEEDKY